MNRLAVVAALAAALLLARPAPAGTLGGASPEESEVAAARNALINGDSAEAVRLFERLHERVPDDPRVLWGLVRAYTASGQDREKVVPLLAERLDRIPADDQTRKELGEAYARIGESDLAHRTWAGLLERRAPDVETYSEIGSIEVQYRMFDHARTTYLDGRSRLGPPSLFAEEMAQVNTALGRFDEAIDECVLMLAEHPGLSQWAVNNVELMLERGASRSDVARRMEALARAENATPPTLAFAGSTLLALGRPEDALEAYLRADDMSEDRGAALLEFADVLAGDGRSSEARRACLLVVERGPGTPHAATAGLKAARIRAGSGDAAGGVAELKAVAESAQGLPAGGEALLEAARIELHTLRDPAAALATLDRLAGTPQGRRSRQEAELLAIGGRLALGRFDEARARSEALASGASEDGVRERAMYGVGYAAFLALDTAGALDAFRAMVEADAAGSLVNDALRLMLVLSDSEESGNAEPLRLLASAHAAALRNDPAGARAALNELAASYPGESAAVEGLLLLAGVEEERGDTAGALQAYARVVEGTASLASRAHALVRSGDLLAADGRPEEALASYRAVLEDLPANFLSGEARRKIESLRRAGQREG
jgi:tetratricopeptide (TPR) repeat protein